MGRVDLDKREYPPLVDRTALDLLDVTTMDGQARGRTTREMSILMYGTDYRWGEIPRCEVIGFKRERISLIYPSSNR